MNMKYLHIGCLLMLPLASASSTYEELIEEEKAELSILEKNAAEFVRSMERKIGGKRLPASIVQTAYVNKIPHMKELEAEHDSMKHIDTIRGWVKQVAPVIGLEDVHAQDGPLHKVLDTASMILGISHEDDLHPHLKARDIIKDIRRFTEAIVAYYHKRGNKEEL